MTTWLGSNPRYRDHRNDVYEWFDPERAAALLDEAGWRRDDDGLRRRDGVVLSVRLMTWGPGKAVGEAIQHQWSKLGVQAEVHHGDYSLIQTARSTGDWDALIEGWQTFGDEFIRRNNPARSLGARTERRTPETGGLWQYGVP